MSKLIFTSKGLNQPKGFQLISKELEKDGDEADKSILLISVPEYGINNLLYEACIEMGFSSDNITVHRKDISLQEYYDYIYVTEGNAFQILKYIRDNQLTDLIRASVEAGATYIGASAGALIAGTDIECALDFDENVVQMEDFTALQLFDGIVIPHYNRKELERYISNCDKKHMKRYANIYSVSNERLLVMVLNR